MNEMYIGEWKLHRDNYINGMPKFQITVENIVTENGITYIKNLDQPLEEMQLEVIAISQKCMVLSIENEIYVLLRNLS